MELNQTGEQRHSLSSRGRWLTLTFLKKILTLQIFFDD
jgi:hypothetical protein